MGDWPEDIVAVRLNLGLNERDREPRSPPHDPYECRHWRRLEQQRAERLCSVLNAIRALPTALPCSYPSLKMERGKCPCDACKLWCEAERAQEIKT